MLYAIALQITWLTLWSNVPEGALDNWLYKSKAEVMIDLKIMLTFGHIWLPTRNKRKVTFFWKSLETYVCNTPSEGAEIGFQRFFDYIIDSNVH